DVPAPAAGTLLKVLKQAGETAAIGEVIAEFEEASKPAETSPAKTGGKDQAASAGTGPARSSERSAPAASDQTIVMPAAARVLDQNSLKPGQVAATGPGG